MPNLQFQTYYEGLSGEIELDKEAGAEFRSNVKLDLIEKNSDRMEKTGTWTYASGVNYTKSEEARQEQTAQKLQNKTLRVVTVPVIYCTELIILLLKIIILSYMYEKLLILRSTSFY